MLNLANRVMRKMRVDDDDIKSEALLHVYEKGIENMPVPYLWVAIKNKVLMCDRSLKRNNKRFNRKVIIKDDDEEVSVGYVFPETEDKIDILELLMCLKKDEKKLFVSMMYSDYVLSDASDILNESYWILRKKWMSLKKKIRRIYESCK